MIHKNIMAQAIQDGVIFPFAEAVIIPNNRSESKGHAMSARKKARWSQRVTETSKALDLEEGVFTWDDPWKIARSLKRSAEASTRRRSPPFRSAMSMLNFYINRAGKTLSQKQRRILEEAKDELRKLYGQPRRSN